MSIDVTTVDASDTHVHTATSGQSRIGAGRRRAEALGEHPLGRTGPLPLAEFGRLDVRSEARPLVLKRNAVRLLGLTDE